MIMPPVTTVGYLIRHKTLTLSECDGPISLIGRTLLWLISTYSDKNGIERANLSGSELSSTADEK